MLYLDNPVGTLHGVMVYRDHANPNLFYYHSERPRISRTVQGTPEMQLLKYKRDITDNPAFDVAQAKSLGGGLFNFTVDIGVSEGVLSSVKAELERLAPGDVTLSPIPFRGGSVRLSTSKTEEEGAANAGFSFFEEVLGASTPTLVGDNRAVFSIVLTQEGATLVQRALQTGLSPVGVIYELNALGMRPAFQVKVTAQYQRVYEEFEVQMGLRSRVGRTATAVEISDASQRLIDSGAVKVEVLEFTDDADLKKRSEAAVDWFKNELLKDFFKPVLQPPAAQTGGAFAQLNSLFTALQSGQANVPSTPPMAATPPPTSQTAAPPTSLSSGVTTTTQTNQAAQAANAGSTDSVMAAFSLRHFRQEELRERSFDYSVQQAVSWNFGAQGMLSTITKNVDVNRCIAEIDLDDEFFTRLIVDVSLASDLTGTGIDVVTVNMEYPAVPDGSTIPHTDGWGFRAGDTTSQRFQCWLSAKRSLEYRYNVAVSFAPDSPWLGTSATARSPWIVSTARRLSLNPFDDVALLDVKVLSSLSSDTVRQAQVELRYEVPDTPPLAAIYIVKPGDPPQSWKLRLSDPDRRDVRARITYLLASGAELVRDWVTVDDGMVVVPDPLSARLRLRVFAQLDAATLVEAVVALNYVDAANDYRSERQLIFTPTALAPQAVEIPIFADGPRTLSYELSIVKTNGQVVTRTLDGVSGPVIMISEG